MVNQIVMTITAYRCPVCDVMHKVTSKKGKAHRHLASLPPNAKWQETP